MLGINGVGQQGVQGHARLLLGLLFVLDLVRGRGAAMNDLSYRSVTVLFV